jgi:hypothetical protein
VHWRTATQLEDDHNHESAALLMDRHSSASGVPNLILAWLIDRKAIFYHRRSLFVASSASNMGRRQDSVGCFVVQYIL